MHTCSPSFHHPRAIARAIFRAIFRATPRAIAIAIAIGRATDGPCGHAGSSSPFPRLLSSMSTRVSEEVLEAYAKAEPKTTLVVRIHFDGYECYRTNFLACTEFAKMLDAADDTKPRRPSHKRVAIMSAGGSRLSPQERLLDDGIEHGALCEIDGYERAQSFAATAVGTVVVATTNE